jgi:hypothetical protein
MKRLQTGSHISCLVFVLDTKYKGEKEMIITAKANGDILNIKPSVFYQGSTEANKIYLIAPFAISSSVSVGFTLPNMTDIPITLMTPSTAISDTLNTWVYDVPVALTQYVGIVKVNISITTPTGTVITLNRCQFEVKRGDEVVLPDEPEADVYASIVQALADIYANFINKVDTNYTDTENDIEQSVINNANGLKLVKTVGDVTVTFEVTENGVEIDGVELNANIDSKISAHNNNSAAHPYIRLLASEAEANSTSAVTTANEAKSIAENAESVALGIDAKATEALSNSEDAVDTANEAKAIALSVEQAKVFDTFADMENWLRDENNKDKHSIGLELLIKSDDVPDYWVTAVLETPNASGYYYEIEENEATVLSVNNKKGIVVLKTDDISDTDETNKWSTAGEKEKVSKIVINGDGTKALLNDGTYGEVGTVDTVNNVLPDENKNITITADDISDTSTTNKFATAEELAQIATNAEDITDLQNNKADKATTLTGYGITDAYTKTEIDNKVASVYKYKGSVANYASLPAEDLTIGDVYNIEDTGDNYAWTGSEWDKLAGTVDLSNYATKLLIPEWTVPLRAGGTGTGEPNSSVRVVAENPEAQTMVRRRANGTVKFSDGQNNNEGATYGQAFNKVYKSLSDLTGIDASSTLAQLCDAMADNSYLNISTSGYANLVPTGETDLNGQLEITKVNANRVRLAWSYQNASRQPIYMGTYRNAGGFLGWKRLITDSEDQTISGFKTFNAPTNIAGTEQSTIKFKTANGGAVIIGKQGANSGSMIQLDQVDGTPRLKFRTSSTAGAMVWEQPENNSFLAMDFKDVVGTVKRTEIWANKLKHPVKIETPLVNTTDITVSGTATGILKTFTATLPSASWTGSSAPYSKEITVSGILSTDKPDFDLNLTSVSYSNIPTIQSAWFNVYRTVQTANTITFYAHEVPSIDIPLLIKVVR